MAVGPEKLITSRLTLLSWYRIKNTRTNGFIGDGYDLEEDARRFADS